MKKFGKWALVLLACGLLTLVLSSIFNHRTVAAAPAGPPATPVNVVNTPNVNVANNPSISVNNFPATQTIGGTVAVSNFPTTQPVSGTVNIGNLSPLSVSVGNPDSAPLPVRDVDNPARQPFFASAIYSISSGSGVSGVIQLYQVPAGKRAVVETVEVLNAELSATFGQSARIFMTTGGSPAGIDFAEPNGLPATYQTRIYADPSTLLNYQVLVVGSTSAVNGSVTITGYLVNLPAM